MRNLTYYTKEILGKKQADIQALEEILQVVPEIKETLKAFDGKVVNARLENKLKEKGVYVNITTFCGSNALRYHIQNRHYNIPNQYTVYTDIECYLDIVIDEKRLNYKETVIKLDEYIEKTKEKLQIKKQINEELINEMKEKMDQIYNMVKEFNSQYNKVYHIDRTYLTLNND